MNENLLLLPKENLEIYSSVYLIENGLREYVIETLSSMFGSRWYQARLPGDVLQKYKDARAFERSIKWSTLVPHHPIYYVDFPDLWKIILRKDNWENAFSRTFRRTDFVQGTLSQLDFIRNKIAHNRKASSGDVLCVRNAYAMLANLIGAEAFRVFCSRATCGQDIRERLSGLQRYSEWAYRQCCEFLPIDDLSEWLGLRDEWWFDESYLGHPVSAIIKFFELLEHYVTLPRGRGVGHKIEAWVSTSRLDETFEQSRIQFTELTHE